MNKIVMNFFICLCVFAISSCAEIQKGSNSSENNLAAGQVDKPDSQTNKGGFHPGIFIGNRLKDVKNFIAEAAKNPTDQNVGQVSVVEKVPDPVEKKSKDKNEDIATMDKSFDSRVYIKAGAYKIKYLALNNKGKNNTY